MVRPGDQEREVAIAEISKVVVPPHGKERCPGENDGDDNQREVVHKPQCRFELKRRPSVWVWSESIITAAEELADAQKIVVGRDSAMHNTRPDLGKESVGEEKSA